MWDAIRGLMIQIDLKASNAVLKQDTKIGRDRQANLLRVE